MTELEAWLILHRAPRIGSATLRAILERFGNPQDVVANPSSIRDFSYVRPETIDAIRHPDRARLDADLAWLEQPNHHLIRWNDPDYPRLLQQVPGAPVGLFCIGNRSILDDPQLAIVGSRNPTTPGTETAQEFARHLAACGLTITSGLAAGIDAAAHRGAVKAGGHTIAVFGTGVDRIYPARHRPLAHEIVESGGCLLSEMPLGTGPAKENFPQRNRIISGLSLGTLVVEAALRSGSLITARLAAEQGREVFAIPGSIHNPLARGCHALIRQGAKLVESATDILEELGSLAEFALSPETAQHNEESTAAALDEEYQTVLKCLGFEPTSVDTVVERSGLTPEAVSSMLLVLELQGFVSAQAGGLYTRLR